MNNDKHTARIALEFKLVNIIKLNRTTRLSWERNDVIYCGRHNQRDTYSYETYDLGLGNPFSHKHTKNCIWRVADLEKSLLYYHQWLWYIVTNRFTPQNLADWERIYLQRFLGFCCDLERINTLVCFCVNTPHNSKNIMISCHAQILWNVAVSYVTHCKRTYQY